jgi:hypothetical protein
MLSLNIRAANLDDAVGIARVHIACWQETYFGILPGEMLAALDIDARANM